MIQKIHVHETFNDSLSNVFDLLIDHTRFLSGGGMTCILLQSGNPDINGNGAIRQVNAGQLTFIEKIFDVIPNQHYAYKIESCSPQLPLLHHKGWLDFTHQDGETRVDWHSHFEITTPLIGRLTGWIAKRKMSQVFQKRLRFFSQKRHL